MRKENMFNVVTIAREYGSGGAAIGRKVAELLGWQFVDKEIIERAASMGQMDASWAERADEQTCAWWERVLGSFRHGGPELYVGRIANTGMGHDILQQFTAQVIQEAGKQGNCVIIGRGSQCVLRNEPSALQVMVYAPMVESEESSPARARPATAAAPHGFRAHPLHTGLLWLRLVESRALPPVRE
jgi:hypothetical protein